MLWRWLLYWARWSFSLWRHDPTDLWSISWDLRLRAKVLRSLSLRWGGISRCSRGYFSNLSSFRLCRISPKDSDYWHQTRNSGLSYHWDLRTEQEKKWKKKSPISCPPVFGKIHHPLTISCFRVFDTINHFDLHQHSLPKPFLFHQKNTSPVTRDSLFSFS